MTPTIYLNSVPHIATGRLQAVFAVIPTAWRWAQAVRHDYRAKGFAGLSPALKAGPVR